MYNMFVYIYIVLNIILSPRYEYYIIVYLDLKYKIYYITIDNISPFYWVRAVFIA